MAKFWKLSVLVVGMLAARVASADPYVYDRDTPVDEPDPYSYGWNEPRLRSGIGVGVNIGGGVSGFTDQTMRNALTTSVLGLWEARASIGTHVPLGLDISYLGEAQNMRTFSGVANGTLVGTTVEAALRYNILPHFAWDPYIFAGVGWQNYELQNMAVATSDSGIKSSENLAEYPMGLGMAYRDLSGLTVDLRGTFRAAPSSTLVQDQNGVFASAHSWEASGSIGYEF